MNGEVQDSRAHRWHQGDRRIVRVSDRVADSHEVALGREAKVLEEAARRMLERASVQLRSGRITWEPWFEAGMELQDAARRLKTLIHGWAIGKS